MDLSIAADEYQWL